MDVFTMKALSKKGKCHGGLSHGNSCFSDYDCKGQLPMCCGPEGAGIHCSDTELETKGSIGDCCVNQCPNPRRNASDAKLFFPFSWDGNWEVGGTKKRFSI
jgi:hypothetical protein